MFVLTFYIHESNTYILKPHIMNMSINTRTYSTNVLTFYVHQYNTYILKLHIINMSINTRTYSTNVLTFQGAVRHEAGSWHA
jgi:hypothetical protein